jgi:hypothetical protein
VVPGAVSFTAARLDGHPLGQAGAYTLDMVDGHGRVRAIPGPIAGGSTFTVRTTSGTERVRQNISFLLYK